MALEQQPDFLQRGPTIAWCRSPANCCRARLGRER